MNRRTEIKQHLLPYFLERLRQTGILRPSDPDKLVDSLRVHYFAPGQRIEQPTPCLFFLVHGLLKEYYRSKWRIHASSFVQLLAPDDLWIYDQHAYDFRTRALLPCWLLELPLYQLHYITHCPGTLKLWLEQLDMCYRSNHCLSSFLQEQSDKNERIQIFLEEYGPYVDYLSNHEIAHYAGLDHRQVEALRNRGVLYQPFNDGNILF